MLNRNVYTQNVKTNFDISCFASRNLKLLLSKMTGRLYVTEGMYVF